jgi:hypothetical protein
MRSPGPRDEQRDHERRDSRIDRGEPDEQPRPPPMVGRRAGPWPIATGRGPLERQRNHRKEYGRKAPVKVAARGRARSFPRLARRVLGREARSTHGLTDILVGKRADPVRRAAGGWKIARRMVVLDPNDLLAESLTFFI